MDISIVAPVVMLLSFTTFFFQYLTLMRKETEVFRDQSLSFYLVHDFCNILPSAAFELIVFPAIVLLYTVMLVCDPRSCLRRRFCHFLLSVVRRIWR